MAIRRSSNKFKMNQQPNISENVVQRLREEEVAWLTTVSPKGSPQPAPIWFLWEEDTLLVYSRSDALRNRNVKNNSQVAFNLNSNERGGDIVVLWGEATVDTEAQPADRHLAYLEKYRAGIARIGMTPESFAATYSVVIRITPTRVNTF